MNELRMSLADDAFDAAYRDFQKNHGTKLSLHAFSQHGISGRDLRWIYERARKYLRLL